MAETEVQTTAAEAKVQEPSDFTVLLQKEFKPKSERAREAVESAVKTLAEQALEQTTLISDDAIKTIQSIIAKIDHCLSDQVNVILHHENFQKLEGSWRGLHYLVNNIETDEMLRINGDFRHDPVALPTLHELNETDEIQRAARQPRLRHHKAKGRVCGRYREAARRLGIRRWTG